MAGRPPKSDTKEAIREAQREWLLKVLAETKKTPSQLAKDSGVSDTTLTRFLNNPSYSGTLTPITVERISEHVGIPGPGYSTSKLQIAAWKPRDEAERVPWDNCKSPTLAALIGGRDAPEVWTIQTDHLALAGIRQGDMVVIDKDVQARDGDIVCAQIENGNGPRTVFRMFQMPNLVGASFDPQAIRPEPVDGLRVRVIGVVTDLLRQRAA
ncbi:Peptidase S24-like [Rhodoblastus acidophilus]|uniref:Peptidase S24-like n=1 Tax=Rhodoblastus acidophilus TaxID=1074 RepID=A0A212RAM4_RHOAC|nr:helix-turn-helix domain-containing protein [Rhodoblastus acidophilus]RAI22424.1 hypothetical protein CH337_05445 [Rhodoblastus acidophilus]SNB69299.1 Peptidase S24-like [Rhodoblastus acidophilus]